MKPNSDMKHTMWDSKLIETLFEQCFFKDYATLLVGGADEPLYLPAKQTNGVHQIFYRFDYFSSALHEVAHWCIAGEQRRQLEDYGYWYEPDGRSTSQQQAFQKVEVKPQAIEMAFSIACNKPFRVSLDNIESSPVSAFNGHTSLIISDEDAFTRAVTKQYHAYCEQGFPARAQQFMQGLTKAFSPNKQAIVANDDTHSSNNKMDNCNMVATT